MNRMTAICAAGLAALACTGALQAHHSGSMYRTTPVWVQGTVVRFEDINPHTITTLQARSEDGQIRLWAVEGPGRAGIDRRGIGAYVPAAGDIIGFCAFPYKSPAELARLFPEADFTASRSNVDSDGASPQFLAGHVMVMPDGEKRMWEPHGVLGECIRSSDEPRQSWLDFLNAEQSAREAWCQQSGYTIVQSDASLRAFLQEIDSLIDDPC